LKSSAWVGAVPFMKRVNQIEEENQLLLEHCCYKLHTVFYPTFLPVRKILGMSVGSEAIINQLLVRKSVFFRL